MPEDAEGIINRCHRLGRGGRRRDAGALLSFTAARRSAETPCFQRLYFRGKWQLHAQRCAGVAEYYLLPLK